MTERPRRCSPGGGGRCSGGDARTSWVRPLAATAPAYTRENLVDAFRITLSISTSRSLSRHGANVMRLVMTRNDEKCSRVVFPDKKNHRPIDEYDVQYLGQRALDSQLNLPVMNMLYRCSSNSPWFMPIKVILTLWSSSSSFSFTDIYKSSFTENSVATQKHTAQLKTFLFHQSFPDIIL